MKLPQTDSHFKKFGINYQSVLVNGALEVITKYSLPHECMVDIGAHVGLLSRQFQPYFERIIAFEPDRDNFDCLKVNLPDIEAHNVAISNYHGLGNLENPAPTNSGAWELGIEEGDIEVRMLDEFNLNPDFIKMDVQGCELKALIGATETIKRSRPMILFEYHEEAKNYLESLGAIVLGKREDKTKIKDMYMGFL